MKFRSIQSFVVSAFLSLKMHFYVRTVYLKNFLWELFTLIFYEMFIQLKTLSNHFSLTTMLATMCASKRFRICCICTKGKINNVYCVTISSSEPFLRPTLYLTKGICTVVHDRTRVVRCVQVVDLVEVVLQEVVLHA